MRKFFLAIFTLAAAMSPARAEQFSIQCSRYESAPEMDFHFTFDTAARKVAFETSMAARTHPGRIDNLSGSAVQFRVRADQDIYVMKWEAASGRLSISGPGARKDEVDQVLGCKPVPLRGVSAKLDQLDRAFD
jgi:hypothetical protein